jgi:CRISPR/Cas system CSM-associated protein Csm4 (group 5 of RAMP superfamily)
MNILDLTQFKNLKELQDYADKQFKTIAIMKNKIDDQTAKIQHLESLLSSKATVLNVGSEQQEICKIEINRLYQKTLRGPLDFAEVKVLETLTKLLLAIDGKEPTDKKEKAVEKAVKAMTPQELINIALQKTPEEQDGN